MARAASPKTSQTGKPAQSKKPAKKRPSARKSTSRRKNKDKESRFSLKGLLYPLILAVFFVFSLGVLAYVIFFRMVVAAAEIPRTNESIVFEEPGQPQAIPYSEVDGADGTGPVFSIIIDDMGYHYEIGKELIELDINLSYSFLPHAPYTAELEKAAYVKGKTVLLHLPLQPKDSKWDAGPGTLYLGQLDRQRHLFLENLRQVPHATGVNNHMGSLYTENKEAMTMLLEVVAEKKLFFIDSFTSPESEAFNMAEVKGVTTLRRDTFLDNDLDIKVICDRIVELANIAKNRGKAIGIAHPHQQTLDAVKVCLEKGNGIGADLVSVEEILR